MNVQSCARAFASIIFSIMIFQISSQALAEYIWIEAESPFSGEVPKSKGWLTADEQQKPLLSGGKWLNFGKSPASKRFVYKFKSSSDEDDYNVYVRKFWNHGKFRWRIDSGNWHTVDNNLDLQNNVGLKKHVSVNWALMDSARLSKGSHSLEIITQQADSPLAIDCFCIANSLFIPQGKLRPDEKTNLTETGYWAFEPGVDEFSDDCVLDLSYLNEDIAGQNGRITTRDGKLFLGDGSEVRLWGVGLAPKGKTLEQLKYKAKRLAKLGVNHVRLHDTFADCSANSNGRDIDKKLLDATYKLVAAMRDEGIYTAISPLFILQLHVQPSWSIPGIDQPTRPFGLIFWDETLQGYYKQWLRQILCSNNPYTGIPLADDPSVYLFQLQNEDSCFFWTFLNGVPQTQKDALAKKYGSWLAQKHGSLEKAIEKFGDGLLTANNKNIHSSDNLAKGTAALLDAWHMTGKYKGNHATRIANQIEFLAELQYKFNAEMTKYLREQCGYKGLVCANNWRTCDDNALKDLEYWTYTACDLIDSHHYVNSPHENPNNARSSSYSVNAGDLYASSSVLNQPWRLPTNIRQIKNFPHIISESTWPQPNNFKAEAPMAIAAYARLTDLDGFLWFCSNGIDYETALTKFQVNIPSIMGQFPAAALAYRSNYLQRSLESSLELSPLTRMYNRQAALLPEKFSFDPNRDSEDITSKDDKTRESLTYLLGQVTASFKPAGRPELKTPQLEKFIHQLSGGGFEVKSLTGELSLNSDDAILKIEAPAIAGICGKFNSINSRTAKAVSLCGGTVTMRLLNDYGAITVISLDGEPLTSSSKILVQAMTHEHLYGFAESVSNKPGMKKIDSLGRAPWNVRNILSIITIANPKLSKATALNPHGYAQKQIPLKKTPDGCIELTLPEDSLYTILE